MHTIKELLEKGSGILSESGIENPIAQARVLLREVLDKDLLYIHINLNEEVEKENEDLYLSYIQRRSRFEPVAYIVGHREFMQSDFYVNNSVLIPRYETELLVEKLIEEYGNSAVNLRFMDMCTGSGCIGLSIRKFTGNPVTLCDISKKALRVAMRNRDTLGFMDVEIIQSDLFENVVGVYDVIVANPPYIKAEDMKHLPKDVLYEPKNALFAGSDGMMFYRRILREGRAHLKPEGRIYFEIGYDEREAVCSEAVAAGYEVVECSRDYQNLDRIVVVEKGRQFDL